MPERDKIPVNQQRPNPDDEPELPLPPITGTMDVHDAEDALGEQRDPKPGE